MGTRADFYVGRGERAEWIGSITWDGYPAGIVADDTPSGERLFRAAEEAEYRQTVAAFLNEREQRGSSVTRPTEPWPWPWEDSRTTDYAYAFEDGAVYGTCHGWWQVNIDAEEFGEQEGTEEKVPFPDMAGRQGDLSHIMGKSGMIVLGGPS
jgi:hypothetical protein